MGQKTPLFLPWPLNGVDRSKAYRDQDAVTTKDASNVRNLDTLESRIRGSVRPGLCKEYDTQLGSGNPIRMLGRVAVAKDANRYRWIDDFNRDTLGSTWTTASWIGTAPSVRASFDGAYADNATSGANAPTLNFSTSSTYSIGLYILPWNATFGTSGSTFSIYARQDNTTPVATTDGIVAALSLSGTTGVYSGTLTSYVSGVATAYAFATGNTTTAKPGWFIVNVATNTITVTYNGVTLVSQAVSAHTGKRVGFGLSTTEIYPSCMALVDCIRVLGGPVSDADSPDYTEHVCALSNGSLYAEGATGTYAAVSATVLCASDRTIRCCENRQKLFVADYYGVRKAGTAGTSSGSVLDDASVTDWTALGIDTVNDVVSIISGTGVTTGNYPIVSVHATDGVTVTGTLGSGSAISYRIERAAKVWDPAAATFTILAATAGKGQVPTGCPLIWCFADRIFLAGAAHEPQVWYAARKGSAGLDWDLTQTDVGRAISSTDDTGAGSIGLPITAAWTASDDNCVMCSKTSIHVMRGDPVTGQFDTVDNRVGVVGPGAFTQGPGGETYFLSRDGMYMLPPGESGKPTPISRNRLPLELIDVDTNLYDILLMYNQRQQGVHIWMSYKTGVPVSQWFLDIARGAYWPESYSTSHEVFSAMALQVNTISQSELLLGCRDGYIRRFNQSSQTDDGTAITSYCYIGPAMLSGNDYQNGICLELEMICDRDSGPIDYTIYTGETNEDAISSSAHSYGRVQSPGLSYRIRPMAGGGSMVVKLANGGTRPWVLERMFGMIESRGRHRVA